MKKENPEELTCSGNTIGLTRELNRVAMLVGGVPVIESSLSANGPSAAVRVVGLVLWWLESS